MSGAKSRASAYFTRMTVSGRRLLRTYSVNALWRAGASYEPAVTPFDVVIWMTDGWPLYESRLKGKLHVISKRYTQRIERHNLNLRQHGTAGTEVAVVLKIGGAA